MECGAERGDWGDGSAERIGVGGGGRRGGGGGRDDARVLVERQERVRGRAYWY